MRVIRRRCRAAFSPHSPRALLSTSAQPAAGISYNPDLLLTVRKCRLGRTSRGRTESLPKCPVILFCRQPAQQHTALGTLLPPSRFQTRSLAWLTGTLQDATDHTTCTTHACPAASRRRSCGYVAQWALT